MKNLLAFFCFIFICDVQAQIAFESKVIINETFVTDGPVLVFAEDMDGDGSKDILVASFLDNQITLYKNVDGNLSREIVIPSSSGTLRFADLADMDGDGDLDILTTKKGNFEAYWLRNVGGGNFQISAYPYDIIGEIRVVKAVDIDQDGALDIIAARSGQTFWFRNTDGLGRFEFTEQLNTVDDLSMMEVADVDGNNYPDLIYSTEEGSQLNILKNTNGVFSSSTLNTSMLRANGVKASDLDGDGDIDLVISSSRNGQLGISYNNNGNFSAVTLLDTGTDQVPSVAVGDLNQDEQPDILFSTCQEGLFAFYNEGTSFSNATFVTSSKACEPNLFIDDIDGDGDNDLMSCDLFEDRVSLYYTENNTIGHEHNISSFPARPNQVVLADLDNDGDLDVMTASADDNKVGWLTNLDGKGEFGHHRVVSEMTGKVGDISVEDVNGDGRLDVLAASNGDNKITWFENLGGQSFFSTDKIISDDCTGASQVRSADLDGNGIMDVVYSCKLSHTLAWRTGIFGPSDFGAEKILSDEVYHIVAITHSDIDGDGDIDLIAAADGNSIVNTPSLFWFENLGAGNFADKVLIDNQITLTREVHLLDYEGDGDLDILVAGQDLRWYLNLDGKGSWGNAVLAFPFSILNIYPHDMDGDGDQDFLMTVLDNRNPHFIWTFDDGAFTITESFDNREDLIQYAAAGDIDQDGDQDLVTCGRFANGTDVDDHVNWMDNQTILTSAKDKLREHSNIIIFPNPASNLIYVKSAVDIISVEIFDLSGKLMLKMTDTTSSEVDCTALIPGTYLFKAQLANNRQEVLKFIKY